MDLCDDCAFPRMWEDEGVKRAKAAFTIGWLVSTLRGLGMAAEEVAKEIEAAEKEFDRIQSKE